MVTIAVMAKSSSRGTVREPKRAASCAPSCYHRVADSIASESRRHMDATDASPDRRARGDLRRASTPARDDAGFWQAMAADRGWRPRCSSSAAAPAACCCRWLGPATRSPDSTSPREMLERCRAKLEAEPPGGARARAAGRGGHDVVRPRTPLRDRSSVPFAGFQQLLTVEQQLACLRALPRPSAAARQTRARPAQPRSSAALVRRATSRPSGEATAQLVDWTDGRRIRWWMTVTGYDRSLQCNECEVTYEIIEADGGDAADHRDDLSCATRSATNSSTCSSAPASASSRSSRRLRPLALC